MKVLRPKFNHFITALFLFCISISSLLIAIPYEKQLSQYGIQVWNMESGLPGNSIYALQQTQDGVLWIGTQNGLVAFNGVDFKAYTREKIPALKSDAIRALYEDRDGNLWIGSSSGGLSRFQNGEFVLYPDTQYKSLDNIRAINQDRWGNIWVGSLTEGLTCITLINQKSTQEKAIEITHYSTENGLPHNQVRFISKDKNGDLWITTTNAIVQLIQPGKFHMYALPDELPYMKTTCLYDVETKNLWIGTGEKGLFKYHSGNFTPYSTAQGIPHKTITFLYMDEKKNLWIGTDGGGLSYMRKGILNTLSTQNGLADGFIYSILADREGSIWIGTLDGGLHQLIDNKFTTFTTQEGLVHNYIECATVNKAGEIWVGSKGGLNKLTNGKVTAKITSQSGLADATVLAVHEDPFGNTWIGTWGGLHRIQFGNPQSITKITGLSDNRICDITGDKNNDTWIATANGLNRYHHKDSSFSIYTTKDGLLSNRVETIFADSKGILWIVTDTGLNIFKNGGFEKYRFKSKSQLEKYQIQCFYEDQEAQLWIGTYDGLICIDKNQTNLYTLRDGLLENHVSSIIESKTGFLWLGGRNGISRILKKEITQLKAGQIPQINPITFNEKDGMKSRWCSSKAINTTDGKIWFPTSMGLTMIDSNRISTNPIPPTILIDKMVADGEKLKIPKSKKFILELFPGKKRFDFYYTAVSLINPQKIRYKLKLDGYDTDWIDVGNLRNTTYTGLKPGMYTFRVIACNSDGVWNTQGATVSFHLHSYFYQTSWFYILLILFIIASILSLHFLRLKRLKFRKNELKALVQIRTANLEERNAELERIRLKLQESKELIEEKNRKLYHQAEKLKELDQAKSHYFANISHEFRTPLTLIQGPLEQILAEKPDKKTENRIHIMLRNSKRLLALVDQLLELAKFDSGKMKLKASLHNIVPFIRGIVMCFESLAAQNNIELTFQSEKDNVSLYFDQEKLERIVINLLSNAFNFTPQGGKIGVSIHSIENSTFPNGCVEVAVQDTGTGIPEDQLPHIFDRFFRGEGSHEYKRKGTGIGLALSKELLALHHGKICVHSNCTPGEKSGSRFTLCLPLGKNHLQPEELIHPSDDETTSVECNHTYPYYTDFLEENSAADPIEREKLTINSKQLTILIVDDNSDMRVYLRSALEPHFIVNEASNGKIGLATANKILPDLVICDVMMPEMNGYELCHKLKSDITTSHIPVILLTAKASEKSMAEGFETGADDYITKPFNADLLLLRIDNLIRLRKHLQYKFQNEINFKPAEVPVSSIDFAFLKEVQSIIESNLEDMDFGVDQLAKKLSISQSTLYRKIDALTGETPNRFIRSYRLIRAAQLLKANFGNITQVALAVGFSSNAYFTKCFKEKFQQLPREYAQEKSL